MMKKNQPLTRIEIDLSALNYNLRQIRKKVKGAGILAVVKADAYGHGAKEIADLLSKQGVEALGVANPVEAQELRRAGIKLPIAILSALLPEQVEGAIDCRAIPTVSDWKLARALNEAGKRRKKKIQIQVKVDTGMRRLGIWYSEAMELIQEIKRQPFLSIKGLFTHFAAADEKDKSFTRLQLRRFQQVISQLEKAKIDIPWRHAANSAAMLDIPESYLNGINMVRPGLILYGAYPSLDVSRSISLKPVMSLKSQIISLKKISRGQSAGYGFAWRAKKDTIIGIIPVGYAMGYSRFLSNVGEVIVKNKKEPVIGRVCMDLILINLGPKFKAQAGDRVTLMGRQGNKAIRVENIAQSIGTIPYEILCLIGRNAERIYRK